MEALADSDAAFRACLHSPELTYYAFMLPAGLGPIESCWDNPMSHTPIQKSVCLSSCLGSSPAPYSYLEPAQPVSRTLIFERMDGHDTLQIVQVLRI